MRAHEHMNVCGWDSMHVLKQHAYSQCEKHPTGAMHQFNKPL